jgi:UPF0042 nucleotide-binding protein
MKVKVSSFSWKHGAPPSDADFVVDCRPMRNPHHSPELRPLTGRDRAVQDFVKSDPRFNNLLDAATDEAVGGRHVAFGCFGGRHRSVALAELTAETLRRAGHTVDLVHVALANE